MMVLRGAGRESSLADAVKVGVDIAGLKFPQWIRPSAGIRWRSTMLVYPASVRGRSVRGADSFSHFLRKSASVGSGPEGEALLGGCLEFGQS